MPGGGLRVHGLSRLLLSLGLAEVWLRSSGLNRCFRQIVRNPGMRAATHGRATQVGIDNRRPDILLLAAGTISITIGMGAFVEGAVRAGAVLRA